MQWGTWDSEKRGEFFVKQSMFANMLTETLDCGRTGRIQAEWKPLLCDLELSFSPLGMGACPLHTEGRETGTLGVSATGLGFLLPARRLYSSCR